MASIPNDLSPAQQEERLEYLQTNKQNWFKYLGGVDLPWLDPATIPVIEEQMAAVEGLEDYWVSEQWQSAFDERYEMASATVAQPPFFQAPASFETYTDFKAPYTVQNNVSSPPDLDDDASFAGQRLWGANPLVIRKVKSLRDLPQTLAIKDGVGPDGIKLEVAVNESRLYICDYSDLGFLAGPGEPLLPMPFLVESICQKYLTAPIGLFYWEGELNSPEGRLLPYAIQLEQQAGAGVFTPKDSGMDTSPVNWRIAKAAFQVADALSHEWDSHLVRTHVILAPFAISGERHLHPDHPVLLLMRPHLRYTLKINSETGELTGQGSFGDLLLAPRNEDLLKLLTHYHKSYMDRGFYRMANLENELAARGMTEENAPIHYPYREDGLPIFKAIRKFVSDYLGVYYENDRDVVGDRELQAFVGELTSDDFGGVKGLTQNGDSIRSLRDLVDVLTCMIWTAGPAHAAVNYAQWDYMADPRNMPFSGYLEEPQAGSDPPFPNHVLFFPQYSLAKLQAGLMYALGTYRMDMLGHYRPKDFMDGEILKRVIPDFQCELAKIGGNTFALDQTRSVTYPYFYPWLIPNSTSI